MNTLHKRYALFLVGCIGTRTLLAYTAKTVSTPNLQIMGWLAILPVIGFTYYFVSGTRQTGVEVFGERIWWNNLRPLHALLYSVFAYMAIMGMRGAWKILALDVVIGLIAFIWKHFA